MGLPLNKIILKPTMAKMWLMVLQTLLNKKSTDLF